MLAKYVSSKDQKVHSVVQFYLLYIFAPRAYSQLAGKKICH